MKVVILAGGLGTRLSEETTLKPKPMVKIGEMPILWHIMKIYSFYGFKEFVVCCGYKGQVIKEFFANYLKYTSNFTIDLKTNDIVYLKKSAEDWKVSLIDTGDETMTGGRILRIKEFTENKPFHLTYGDGLSDININNLMQFHVKEKTKITITAVQPKGRFGSLGLDHKTNIVSSFKEKPKENGIWINGGYMICEQEVFSFIENDKTVFEEYPLSEIAKNGQMKAYKHRGFWRPMDTLKDKNDLNTLWDLGDAKWKCW